MNILRDERKLSIVSALVEGNSIRSIERMTGVHRDTVVRVLLRVGEGFERRFAERMRRFTRLTNAFSKRLPSLRAAVALHFAHYNFVRAHITLKITPAMAAGVTDHFWTLEDLLAWEASYSAQASLN